MQQVIDRVSPCSFVCAFQNVCTGLLCISQFPDEKRDLVFLSRNGNKKSSRAARLCRFVRKSAECRLQVTHYSRVFARPKGKSKMHFTSPIHPTVVSQLYSQVKKVKTAKNDYLPPPHKCCEASLTRGTQVTRRLCKKIASCNYFPAEQTERECRTKTTRNGTRPGATKSHSRGKVRGHGTLLFPPPCCPCLSHCGIPLSMGRGCPS